MKKIYKTYDNEIRILRSELKKKGYFICPECKKKVYIPNENINKFYGSACWQNEHLMNR